MRKPNFPGLNTVEVHSRHHMEEFEDTMNLLANNIHKFCKRNGYQYELAVPDCFCLKADNASVVVNKVSTYVTLDKIAYENEITFSIKLVTGLHNGFALDYDVQLEASTGFISDNTIDLVDEIADSPFYYVTAATPLSEALNRNKMKATLDKAVNAMASGIEKVFEETIQEGERRWQQEIS